MYKYLIISCLFLSSICNTAIENNSRAFYYWKTTYQFNKQEQDIVNKLAINKFYVRFFDIDWSTIRQEAIPIAELNIDYGQVYPKNYVPCVFITNTVMLKSTNQQLKLLASRINSKINKIEKDFSSYYSYNQTNDYDSIALPPVKEIQIDCDWTPNSKENYFYFLNELKKSIPEKEISVTLRLWQLKYQEKAGVPPADRVMLMCYSTGNPKEYNIENSLANFESIQPYIKNQSYDLPVDIALPLYNWAILFRNRKFKGIIRDLNPQIVKQDTFLFKKIKQNHYFFKTDTVLENTYIRYGDEIRLESFSKNDMEKLIELLNKEKLHNSKSTISFFSWDTTYIKNYGYENIKNYYNNLIIR
jgi:hypothetical protein